MSASAKAIHDLIKSYAPNIPASRSKPAPDNRANLTLEAWGQKWDVKATLVRGYQQTMLEPGVENSYEIEGIYLPYSLIDLSEMLDSKLVESIQIAADRAAREAS